MTINLEIRGGMEFFLFGLTSVEVGVGLQVGGRTDSREMKRTLFQEVARRIGSF